MVLRVGTDLLIVAAEPVRKRRRLLAAGALLLCFVVSLGAGWRSIRSYVQAYAVLRLVSGQAVPGWARAIVVHPVSVTDTQLSVRGTSIRARLYSPEGEAHAPALMVLHGVHHLGIDEPRLTGFAQAMASMGIRVLTPELPGIKDYRVGLESVQVIGESANWFATSTGGPVAVMGLSFSGGLALVAAADPAYRQSFGMVFAVGSQDAMEHVSEYYMTSRAVRPDGTVEQLAAHEYGPLVLEYEHLDDYVPAGDVAAVGAVLRSHLYEDRAAEQTALHVLTGRQRAEVQDLMDARSEKTRLRLAGAQARYRQQMQRLSPHGTLGTVAAPVYLLHGAADNIIPASETLWMASELGTRSLRAVLVSPVLSHLDMDGAEPKFQDQMRLLHFFAQVMRGIDENGRRGEGAR